MTGFHFYHPVAIRYSDLDPQGHVNNASYLTYFEEARAAYIKSLGLWSGVSFLDIGIIVAAAQITYLVPILYSASIQVGVRVSSLGNKSITMEYAIEQKPDAAVLATGNTILVAFDYKEGKSIPVPDSWRKIIGEFDSLPEMP